MANNRMALVNTNNLLAVWIAKTFIADGWVARGDVQESLYRAFARSLSMEFIATETWVVAYEIGPNSDWYDAACRRLQIEINQGAEAADEWAEEACAFVRECEAELASRSNGHAGGG